MLTSRLLSALTRSRPSPVSSNEALISRLRVLAVKDVNHLKISNFIVTRHYNSHSSSGRGVRTVVNRYFSSKKNERNVTLNDEYVNDANDEEETFNSDRNPLGPDGANSKKTGGRRVKVKFNWKNSLVSADSVNLLESLYQRYPQLIEYNESQLVDYLQRMSLFAIEVDRAAEILIIYPRMISTSPEKISSAVSGLQRIGLSENQRRSVLRRAPHVVEISPKKLAKQAGFLKTYFSTAESVELLSKSVDVFLESELTLKRKLDYLIRSMSHETKDIVSCRVLSYSITHMKTRHEFLIRAGLFKPIPYSRLIKVLEKDHKDKGKGRNKYFRPIHVVCFKDEDFLKVCTNNMLTLNELAAFEELYEAELAVLNDLDEDPEDEESDNDTGDDDDDEDDAPGGRGSVSLIKDANSLGFFSATETKSCYF